MEARSNQAKMVVKSVSSAPSQPTRTMRFLSCGFALKFASHLQYTTPLLSSMKVLGMHRTCDATTYLTVDTFGCH